MSAVELQFFYTVLGTMKKIAEMESTQGYIQMHAAIPEMVTKRLNHSTISFIVAGGPQKNKL